MSFYVVIFLRHDDDSIESVEDIETRQTYGVMFQGGNGVAMVFHDFRSMCDHFAC